MCTVAAPDLSIFQPRKHEHDSLRLGSLKRKLSPYLHPVQYGDLSYPSPPMSNPPSPSRVPTTEELPVSHTAEQEQQQQQPSSADAKSTEPTSTAAPAASSSSHMPAIAAVGPTLGPPFYQPITYAPAIPAIQPTPPTFPLVPALVQTQSTGAAVSGTQPAATTSAAGRPTSSRGGRKSKAHVASACINCKRAHLSCDVNRPCARCVASGKQDTCFDVQHKKRGRPRLREEGEFKVEQMMSDARPATAVATGGTEASRPIATTRHRRQESFRSLRSQGSDGSGVASSPTYPYPPPPTATQATFGFHYPAPAATTSGYEIPTAYLDLDLVVIKANSSWRQIMLGGQEVAGRQLHELAAPADGENFQNIRNRLRAERERRDPSYMPPINQPGQDPLQGASEADVDRYTQGFDDHTHTWTQTQAGSSAQTFPARVRLARATAYFVAVTLPSFRPVDPPPAPPPLFTRMQPQPLGSGLQTRTPETYGSPARPLAPQSAPPTAFVPFPGSQQALPAPPRSVGQHQSARTYPPPQLATPYQQHQQYQLQQQNPPQPQQTYPSYQPAPSGTPRLPVAEPPTETTAFTPRSAARELPQPQPSPAGPQLAPIVGSPAARPGPITAGPSELRRSESSTQQQEQQQQQQTDTDDEGTPRKRRRLGIDDVLQR